MQDGTPWPGNNVRDHPGMIQVSLIVCCYEVLIMACYYRLFIFLRTFKKLFFLYKQVFLGQSGGLDCEGNELPRLVYVSREKRPGYNHHKKAGAMNALVIITSNHLFICLL